MKRSLLLLVLVVLTTSSFVKLQGTERTNHYTQVLVFFMMESEAQKYPASLIISDYLESMIWIKGVMQRTDTTLYLHQVGFGPFIIKDDPARDSIIAAHGYEGKHILASRAWETMDQSLKDPQSLCAQRVQLVKYLTGADVVTVVIMAEYLYYVSYGVDNSPIMVLSGPSGWHYFIDFHNKIIFDETSINAAGYMDLYPTGHPLETEVYSTLLNLDSNLDVYPREGLFQDQYGFWLVIGNEDQTVLDPQYGWKLNYLYNKGKLMPASGTWTLPDTLTTKYSNKYIELFPGWNDSQKGKVLYVGEAYFNVKVGYPDPTHIGYLLNQGYYQGYKGEIGAYAVAIDGMDDAFAMDYIWIQVVEDIAYPSIDQTTVPSSVNTGEEFTISLKGDVDMMTSWYPEFEVSGVECVGFDTTNHSVTLKALTAGQMHVTLHHRSLLVLDDESITITVNPSTVKDFLVEDTQIEIYPNPTADVLNLNFSLTEYNLVHVRIFDINGRVLNNYENLGTEFLFSFDVSDYSPGVFFVEIEINGKKTYSKFIKENKK